MASVLAIVSKAAFEPLARAAGGAKTGTTVLPLDRYTGQHTSLATLADGGSLFLVTVRPNNVLWLVGILEDPTLEADGWHAKPNATRIADITPHIPYLKFSGEPRVLTKDDVARLRICATGIKTKPGVKVKKRKQAPKAKPAKPVKQKLAPSVIDLDAIGVALDDDDAGAALDAALAAWRQTRAPALADLVDAISGRIEAVSLADGAAWNGTARARDAADVGRLLAAIPDFQASFLPTVGAALAGFAEDPRIAMAVATWALDPPTTSSSTYPFWTKMIDAMARAADARVIPILRKRLRQPKGDSQFWPKFYAALEKAIEKIEAVVASPVDVKAVAKLTKTAGTLAVTKPRAAATPKQTAPKLDGTSLAQAAKHLAAGRVAAGIEALGVAWRANRAPAIADAIDRANKLLPAWDRALGMTDKEIHDGWLTAFADDALGNLPALLEYILAGGPAAAEQHLAELASLPDDPRIARRLAELCSRRVMSPERTQFWKALFELVARTADPRTAPHLCAAFRDFGGTYYNHHRQARRIIGDWAQSPPVPPALGPKETTDLTAIATALATLERAQPTTELELLRAIGDAPDDVGPRLVYADWLTERGHPRGEYIVLACKPEPTAAEQKRLREMGRKLTVLYGYLDEIAAPWADTRGLELDRGMPTMISVDWDTSTLLWQRLLGYPLMAVVEGIRFETSATRDATPPAEDFARVLLDPTARRLAKVRDAPADLVRALEPLVAGRWKAEGRYLVRAGG